MISTFRWYWVGLLALFGAYVALEYYQPKPVDWRPTFINKDKIPYGTYVLYDQLPQLLGTDSIETIRLPIYNQLNGVPLEVTDAQEETQALTQTSEPDTTGTAAATTEERLDSTAVATAEQPAATSDSQPDPAETQAQAPDSTATVDDEEGPEADTPEDDSLAGSLTATRANYLFVGTQFNAGIPDTHSLLRFVANGNDVFIVAEDFGDSSSVFLDTLGVRTRLVDVPTRAGPQGLPTADSATLHFTNPALAGPHYRLPGLISNVRLAAVAGQRAHTLAADAQGRPVLIRLDYGQGHLYLCSVPQAFSNQFVLRPATSQFAATALSYLPARRTWWDEYQKQGRPGDQSLLRIVRGHEALNTAYYLLIFGGLLFVLVEARRRQRVIPTIRPLPNTTLLFTRTVASLYRQGSSHALIAEKKVGLFMDYLRTRFQEATPDFGDADFRERLSQKSGLARPRVDELLRLVNFARTAPQLSDQQLLLLSKALSDFKREANR